MSENWYPVIDISSCNNCGKCVGFCRHSFFEMQNGKMVISLPQECIWGCKECGGKCPQNAIMHICDFQNLALE